MFKFKRGLIEETDEEQPDYCPTSERGEEDVEPGQISLLNIVLYIMNMIYL